MLSSSEESAFMVLLEENRQLRYESDLLACENQELKKREAKLRREVAALDGGYGEREKERMNNLENYRIGGHKKPGSRGITLPGEILGQIMGYLDEQGDKKTLHLCALVCRSWATSSRQHTFPTLTISLWKSPAHRLRLYGLLDHPLCTFASAVRTLRIDADANDRYGAYVGWLDPLVLCLSKLTAVSHLHCTPVTEWHATSAWNALLKDSSFTAQIHDLTLEGVTFASIEEFVHTIQSFPLLIHLRFQGHHHAVTRNTWGSTLPSLPFWKPLPNLRSLQIDQSFLPWSRLVWDWLRISQTRPPILILDAVTLNDFVTLHQIDRHHEVFRHGEQFRCLEAFSQYLQFLGPFLEILKINFQFSHPDSRHGNLGIPLFLENVDLSPVVGLRVLEIKPLEIHFKPEELHITHGSTLLPIFLSKLLPQQHLTEVVFEIREAVLPAHMVLLDSFDSFMAGPSDGDAESDEAWELLDVLLTSQNSFPVLKQITFRLPVSRQWFDDLFLELELLGRKLPRCQTKFRLRTCF